MWSIWRNALLGKFGGALRLVIWLSCLNKRGLREGWITFLTCSTSTNLSWDSERYWLTDVFWVIQFKKFGHFVYVDIASSLWHEAQPPLWILRPICSQPMTVWLLVRQLIVSDVGITLENMACTVCNFDSSNFSCMGRPIFFKRWRESWRTEQSKLNTVSELSSHKTNSAIKIWTNYIHPVLTNKTNLRFHFIKLKTWQHIQ